MPLGISALWKGLADRSWRLLAARLAIALSAVDGSRVWALPTQAVVGAEKMQLLPLGGDHSLPLAESETKLPLGQDQFQSIAGNEPHPWATCYDLSLKKVQNPCCDHRTLSISSTFSNVFAELLVFLMMVGSLGKISFIIPDINCFFLFSFNRLARRL